MHAILLDRKGRYLRCENADAIAKSLVEAIKIVLSQV